MERISKSFNGVRVLRDVGLIVRRGEVHGLIGQNGSGKSTLIKILAGYHHPDPGGAIAIGGKQVPLPLSAAEARRLGLSFLHQDLGLCDSMSVVDNLLTGQSGRRSLLGRIRWSRERAEARSLLLEYGVKAHPDTSVSELSQAERAIVAIVRALEAERHDRDKIIVLDEPTAQLPAHEVEVVFAALRSAVRSGAGAILVSHRLNEVRSVTDRISVLRDGVLVGTVETATTHERELATLMLGREIGDLYPGAGQLHARETHPILSVRGLSGGSVREISFDVHPGEILGVTGLVGMGHDDVPYLILGAAPVARGEIHVGGKHVKKCGPRELRRLGVVLLPADRQRASSMQDATVRENVSLPIIASFFRHGILDQRRERAHLVNLVTQYDVRPPRPERRLASLSGGNQQKALFAKWMQLGPRVLLLHEPTHGVDIGARRELFKVIEASAVAGTGVVVFSAEYEELAHLCSTVIVMRHGRVASILHGPEVSEERIADSALLNDQGDVPVGVVIKETEGS